MPSPLTPQSVLATFAAVDLELSHADAENIARRVNFHDGDAHLAEATCLQELPIYGKLVAYQGALAELADPAAFAERLRFEADCETERGDRCRREADEYRAKIGTAYTDASMMAAARERAAVQHYATARRKLMRARELEGVAA